MHFIAKLKLLQVSYGCRWLIGQWGWSRKGTGYMYIIDEHESQIAHIFVRLEELSSPAEPTVKAESKELNVLWRCLIDLDRSMRKVNAIWFLDSASIVASWNNTTSRSMFSKWSCSKSLLQHCYYRGCKGATQWEIQISDAIFSIGLKVNKLLSSIYGGIYYAC